MRNNSLSSSVSSRPTVSNSSRNTSFSSSIGNGPRPATSHGLRGQNSMAISQSTTSRSNSTMQRPRAATSMANRPEEDNYSQKKEKGTGMLPSPSRLPFVPLPQGYSTIQVKKSRDSKFMHSLRSSPSRINMRDTSVSTAMSMLRIDENPWADHQAIKGANNTSPSSSFSFHKPSTSSGSKIFRLDSTENALILFQAPGDSLVAPKTPSQIPVISKMEAVVATPATPSMTPKKSPQKTMFLSKTSNIPAFTEFNIEGRLESVEAMFSKMTDTFSGTLAQRTGLDDAINIFRTRGKTSL